MAIPILKTKLNIPQQRADYVPRQRLIHTLNASSGKKLVLIAAQAGSGKSSLVVDWLATLSISYVWLSLDDRDRDVERFVTYLIAALQQVESQIGAEIQAATELDFADAMTIILNDLEAITEPLVVVLDDYHAVDNPNIHEGLDLFLDYLPAHITLVITTRVDPPLSLARLRARNQVVEIRQRDLRFTVDETAGFLNEVMGLHLTEHEVQLLEKRTEGWAAGLQMAGVSLQSNANPTDFIEQFAGSHRFITDYLIDEVLSQQAEPLQHFLMQTAVLERLNVGLCQALLPDFPVDDMLTQLEQKHLFLIPLDESREWFRYHHLFGELLLNSVINTSPELVPMLHLRASIWYEQNDYADDAIAHALAGDHVERAIDLVEANSTIWVGQMQFSTFAYWLERIPEDLVLARPLMCITVTWLHVLTLRTDALARYIAALDQYIQHIDDPFFLSHALTVRAYAIRNHASPRDAVVYAQEALDGVDAQRAPDIVCTATMNLGIAYHTVGDLLAAQETLLAGYQCVDGTQNYLTEAGIGYWLVRTLLPLGNLHEAEKIAQRVVAIAANTLTKGFGYITLAMVYYQQNRDDEARQQTAKALEFSRLSGDVSIASDVHLLISKIRLSGGDIEGALHAVQQAQEITRRGNNIPWIADPIRNQAILTQLAAGYMVPVQDWIAEKGFSLADEPNAQTEREFIVFLQLILVLQPQQAATVIKILPNWIALAMQGKRRGNVVAMLLLMVQAHVQLSSYQPALDSLEEALDYALPQNNLRLLIDRADVVRQVVDFAEKHRQMTPNLRRIKDMVSVAAPPTQTLIEPLSDREIEVLGLMANGLTNQQIADQLFLALGTVKRHANNIYGKMGVKNRTSAIAKGQELQLI